MIKIRRMSSSQRDSSKKYDTISLENRKTLVRLVVDEERSISKSAKRLGIKLSTAKLIIKKFKDSGSFFEKKRDRENRERAESKLSEQNRNDISGQINNALPLGSIANSQQPYQISEGQHVQHCPSVNIIEPNFYYFGCYPNQWYWM